MNDSSKDVDNSDINIIVVDDSDLSRNAISETIKSAGYTVSGEASNALSALELAKSSPCDIFIIDVVMPEVSGIELARMISETFRKKSIIMISSLNIENVIIDSISNGAVDFIQKPFAPNNLITSISNIAEQIRKDR